MVTNLLTVPKRVLVGRPLRSERLGETLLPKKLALPVFCSDPLSSNAYATEEILLVLSLGGLSLLYLPPSVAAAVVTLLIVVVASYRQTCHACLNGGGAYAVTRANLGPSSPRSSGAANYLRVYVPQLRRKLERDPTSPRHRAGDGYRFKP